MQNEANQQKKADRHGNRRQQGDGAGVVVDVVLGIRSYAYQHATKHSEKSQQAAGSNEKGCHKHPDEPKEALTYRMHG